MTNEEAEKIKNELMKEQWTEDMHASLKDFDPIVAKKIIESMSDNDIYIRVNNRMFQEDYIADYLDYLWDISEDAFWKHVIISLNIEDGVLWADHMPHFEKMCRNELPYKVLECLIDFLIQYRPEHKGQYQMDIDAVSCVFNAQVNKFGRIEDIRKYIHSLKIEDEEQVLNKIELFSQTKCSYNFG